MYNALSDEQILKQDFYSRIEERNICIVEVRDKNDLKSLASSWKNLKSSNSNTVFAIFAVIRRILEPGATVKILSLVLGFGIFSVVMVIAVAVHLLCYEEQKSSVRAVLHRHKKSACIDHSLV